MKTGKRVGATASYTCQNGFILFGDNVSNFEEINKEKKFYKKEEKNKIYILRKCLGIINLLR